MLLIKTIWVFVFVNGKTQNYSFVQCCHLNIIMTDYWKSNIIKIYTFNYTYICGKFIWTHLSECLNIQTSETELEKY